MYRRFWKFRQLLESLKVKYDDEDDDQFFHVTCHIDSSLRAKIAKGVFVELDKLLSKTRNQIMQGSQEQEGIEVIRNGSSYVLPPISKESRINNIRRWEQAFRVYAAIYSEHNPDRATEIWQYVHIINTAASSFIWENVAFYDYTFRQLMHAKPKRYWAKIYNQVWNLAMWC